MQDGRKPIQAIGDHHISDGHWYHAAAVFDRQSQQLSLYLDGKLDVGAGDSGSHNPVDISSIAGSANIAPVSLGNNLVGSLDDVSIFRSALKPTDFNFLHDYPAPYGDPKITYPVSGTYQSPTHCWGKRVKLSNLTVAADLNDGRVTVLLETSDDGFRTVKSQTRVAVKDGINSYPLDSVSRAACDTRICFDLWPGRNGLTTPVIDAFRIEGK
ncbi:MAG TPA: LamG-like jellyroll fold domain-containing protein, partial [Tepidisphaeraceae bacterium]|nr:LamG-like jellyroll fold domain-containing protein [Tepidisphaeraceae bacterium]